MLLVRGTHDLIHQDAQTHIAIIENARSCASRYGFSDIITPLLEYEGIFSRTLGSSSDIIRKEMFVLEQKGEDDKESIILRPEATASVMRALFMNGLHQTLPQKFFYAGPMFRYDRPQKGRLRQFHQFGVEFLGTKSIWAEVEIIILAFDILNRFKIPNLTLEINTLGDNDSRSAYRAALVDYFLKVKTSLSLESQERLEKNPFRILDSKSSQDKALLKEAPLFKNYLSSSSQSSFETLLKKLERAHISFKINPYLVRGLDYYSHTVFEITTSDLGAQSTVLAGGRYDALSTLMGNPAEIPAVGWAAGIERIALLLEKNFFKQGSPLFALIPLSEEYDEEVFCWTQKLRSENLKAHFIPEGKISQKFKTAMKLGCQYCLIFGEEEQKNYFFKLKNFETGEEKDVSQSDLLSILRTL